MTRSGMRRALAVGAVLLAAACEPSGGPAPEKPADKGVVKAVELVQGPASAKPSTGEGTEVYKIPLGDSPARGGRTPKVTLVAFSEFQCPFCARAATTSLSEVARSYGDELRVVFKHRPLPFHDRALPAALAAEAAGEQGKFWEMHDKMFGGHCGVSPRPDCNQQKVLDPATLDGYATELGLDVPRWKAAMAGSRARSRVEADQKLAEQFAVRGTPTFFINGRMLTGAQPVERFRSLIDEEIKKADQKLAAGVSRAALYDELTRRGLERREGGPVGTVGAKGPGCPGGGAGPGCGGGAAPAADPGEGDGRVYKVDLGTAPARGPRDAAVTVALFSDFQCPFCGRLEPTLAALEKEYPGRVRVVWKNFPLPFHESARGAAVAALAAGEQGRFWEMHDKLIQNQQALGADDLEKYARELGLDVGRWKSAMVNPATGQVVDADVKQGQGLGVSGTPSLFINGRKVVGARPLADLKTIVDDELGKIGKPR